MTEHPLVDPFGPTANPEFYVPRAATERALDHLAMLVGSEGHRLVLFTGPPGMGKTQLLRMLVERLPREIEPLYLPIASLPLDGLCAFALAELRVPCAGDPAERLVERAREGATGGRRLVLLCDDASALGGTVSKLAGLVAEAAGGLAAILACDEARAGPLRTALGPSVPEVSLTEPMTLVETARYIRVRLAVAEVSPLLWRCFDPPTLEHLHREGKGIPRCVNQEAGALLRDLAERSLNGRQEPTAPVEVTLLPARPADPAAPAPVADEPPIPPLREARSRRKRYRLLRVVELGLATLVAGLVVVLVMRSGVPPLAPFDHPGPRGPAASVQVPPVSGGPAPSEGTSPPGETAPPAVSTGPPPATQEPSAGAGSAAPPPAPSPQPAPPAEADQPSQPTGVHSPSPPPSAPEPTPAGVTGVHSPPPPPASPRQPTGGASSAPPVASAPPPAPAAPAPPSQPAESAGRSPAAAPVPQPPPPAAPAPSPERATARSAPPVSVNVNADPWAEVEIDGKPVGVTPLAGLRLTPGDHVFRASLPDGRVIERTVRVGPGSRFVHFP